MGLRGTFPGEAIHLVGFGVVRGDYGLSGHVQVARVKQFSDLLFGLAARSHLVDHFEDRSFIYEFGTCVNVQKYSVGKKSGSCHVARPHFKVILRYGSFLVFQEKFRQSTDLFEVLGSQNLLHHDI